MKDMHAWGPVALFTAFTGLVTVTESGDDGVERGKDLENEASSFHEEDAVKKN
ncbi:hypothetical protein BDV12DRAFT_197731 [Aspergillus spectabilis]